jgi:hypothetical protein
MGVMCTGSVPHFSVNVPCRKARRPKFQTSCPFPGAVRFRNVLVFADLGVDGNILLDWILGKWDENMNLRVP